MSRWQQRKMAKAHMYATSNEKGGVEGISARRQATASVSRARPILSQHCKARAVPAARAAAPSGCDTRLALAPGFFARHIPTCLPHNCRAPATPTRPAAPCRPPLTNPVSPQATYVPRVGGDWKGRAWGLASTKVGGKQARDATRFSAGKRGELFYGQKRGFSTDAPPEDPVSYLNRGRGDNGGKARDEDLLKKVRPILEG